ncbi:MAG: CpsB/CapC family capsule biosynthesis tyrosine phosphatase [Bacteroidota bacterium]
MEKNVDFSVLGVDLHSHLIPGVDDGSPDPKASIELIRSIRKMGFQKIITTPHVYQDLYPNSRTDLLHGLEHLREALDRERLEIDLSLAAEYFIDDQFLRLIKQKDVLTLPGNQVLVEMSFLQESPNLHPALFQLQTKGYRPILAHPERYLYYKKRFDQYHRLKELGCRLQVNILSLTGYYGKPTKEVAFRLLKEKLVDYLATDLHHAKHAALIHKSLEDSKIQAILQTYPFENSKLRISEA